MNTSKSHFCDYCDDYVDVNYAEREKAYDYKGESITIEERYPCCVECGKEVYDEETGDATLQKLSRKYYELKHGMTVEDFKKIRWDYGLSQVLFSKVLNWGISTVKRYETGVSLPDSTHIAIYKILRSNPAMIIDFYTENKDDLTEQEREQVAETLNSYLTMNQTETKIFDLFRDIYDYGQPTIYTGFTFFKPSKLFNMIIYFAKTGVLKTKLMKLLWYSDFLMYKKQKKSISGISYVRFSYGPVPKNHDLLLGTMESINSIIINEEELYNGYIKITINSQEQFNSAIFDQEEIETLEYVSQYFENYGSKAIADFSHQEEGWLQTLEYKEISYDFAESLRI